MFRKFLSLILIIAHILTFGFVRDALAFQMQSASYGVTSSALSYGGNARVAQTLQLKQDAIAQSCIGKAQSASFVLESGYLPTIKSTPPVQSQIIPNQAWAKNTVKNNAFDLDDYFMSPDGLALTYSVNGQTNITVTIDAISHQVSFSQTQGWSGTEKICFTATDTEQNFVIGNEVTLQVEGGNNPPVLDFISDISADENALVAIAPHATDADNDAIVYSFSAPLNAQGQWQTGYEDSGLYTVVVTATDATNLFVSQSVHINVRNVNRLPILNTTADIAAKEGDLVTIAPVASDPDGQALIFYYGAPFDSSGKWQTGYDDSGDHVVVVTVSDGIDTISQNVHVIVQNINRPPQASLTLSDYTVKPTDVFNINLSASDSDNDAMTYVIKKDDQEISSGAINGVQSIQASFSVIGDHSITAILTDSNGASVTATKGVDVVDPNINKYAINPVMGDFNGDGLADLGLHNSDIGVWEVCISDAGVFRNAVDWLSGFGATRDWAPVGGDFNGDGKTDVAVYNSATGVLNVALSNGAGFTAQGTWLNFSGSSSSWQTITGNFNADKYTDFAVYNKDTGEMRVALGTGSGFGAFATWLNAGDTAYIATSGDFNGDGLTDLCLYKKATGEFKVIFSNSKAFVDGAVWGSGFATGHDPIFSDFNHDGLTDVGYWDNSNFNWDYAISSGSTFVNKGVWLNSYGSPTDEMATTGDFNGDSVTDRALFKRDALGINRWSTQLNTAKIPDLLTTIDNGIGGKTEVAYTYASAGDNPGLPFPVSIASSVALVDSLPIDQSEERYTQNFTFSGGYYDAVEREFRGFSKVKATDPITNNYTETYFYLGKLDEDGALKGQIEKAYAYDGNNQKISESINTYEVRKAGPENNVLGFPSLKEQTATVWDGSTSLTTRNVFAYDNIGNVVEAVNEGDVARIGDEKSSQTSYAQAYTSGFNRSLEALLKDKDSNVVSRKIFEYDTKGNLSKEIVSISNPLTSNQTLATSNYSYDIFGNALTTTDALNRTVTAEYETTFNAYPQKITNVLGQFVTNVYDPKLGVVTSSTDANGQTSTTVYDSLGRVLEARNVNNDVVASYSYPDFNTKVTTNALGLAKTEYADGLGRKYKTVSIGEDGAAARAVSSESYYNNRGLVDRESIAHYVDEDAEQIAYTRNEYDIRGRVKKTIADFPGVTADAESSIDYISPLHVETTDPQGHKKGTLKDVYGNNIKVTEFTSSGVYDTNYEYDIQGNLTKTIDSKGNSTQIWYDSIGRKLKMNDPDMGVWTYEYDILGNLKKQTDAKGQVLQFEYDVLNRLVKKSIANTLAGTGGQQTTDIANYFYDDAAKENCVGRLSKITDQSGSTEFFYDKLGREVKSIKTVDVTPYTVERTYDILDRLLTLKYPDGEVANYSYDANSGLLEKVQGSVNYVNDIVYNAKGQIKTIGYGNGTSTNYVYGQDLRLARISTNNAQSTNLQDLNYIFDKNGNITTLTDNLRNNIRDFIYDDLDRLIQAKNIPNSSGGHTDFNFQYDSIGNMIYKSDVGVMSYGTNAGPHAVTSAGGYSYAYDSNGNQITGKNKTLSYDVENRLKTVVCGPSTVDYSYDGDGGLVKQNSTNSTTQQTQSTLYIGSLYEVESSGIIKKNIFAGSQKVCAVDHRLAASDQVNYFHSDHLGSSSIITDQNGQQVAHYEYSPYGAVAQTEGADVTKYKFTGKQLFDSIGLYHYGARFYDPEIGRFITADTIVQAPYDPQSLNRYAYCRNNPINYVDPSGHSWFSKFWGTIVGAVAGIVGTILSGGNMMVGFQIFNFFQSLQSTVNTGNWGAFAGGLAGGLIGGYAGGALAGQVAGALGKSAFTFGGGFLVGATEMGVAGFGGSFGGALGGGASFGDAMESGAVGLGIGAAVGGLVEGSYLSGMQKFAHGMSRQEAGQAAHVQRVTSLEVVRKPLPKLAKDFVSGEGGDHWGLRIRDNYNEFNGTWDFDCKYARNKPLALFGTRVPGHAGSAINRGWTDAVTVETNQIYVTKVYANIQENIGDHYYEIDKYNCQTWVNNRRYLINDNFN